MHECWQTGVSTPLDMQSKLCATDGTETAQASMKVCQCGERCRKGMPFGSACSARIVCRAIFVTTKNNMWCEACSSKPKEQQL